MTAKVLVIDDSFVVRQTVIQALAGGGFVIVEAVDGLDGLQKLVESPDTRLIVCDVNMPRMGGLEFLEEMGKTTAAKPPVMMLTTEGQPELIARAKTLGARAWMVKPFKREILLAAVRKLAA